jgi:hypothetical protein
MVTNFQIAAALHLFCENIFKRAQPFLGKAQQGLIFCLIKCQDKGVAPKLFLVSMRL